MPPVVQPAKMTSEQLWAHVLAHPLAGADDGTVPAGEGGGEGQGADAGSSGLYDLSNVPEDVRESLMPHLKAIEGNATKKFQEHAQYRDQWKPYEELGLNEMDPQELQQLLDFADLAQDDDGWKGYIEAQAKELGLLEAAGTEGEPGTEFEGMSPDEIQAEIDRRVEERVSPLEQRLSEQDSTRAVQEAKDAAENRLVECLGEAGIKLDDFPDEQQDRVYRLAMSYHEMGDDDPVGSAFKELQELVAGTENGLLSRKVNAPRAPEGAGGQAATATAQPKTFKEAGAAGLERIRQSLQT